MVTLTEESLALQVEVGREVSHISPEKFNLLKSFNQSAGWINGQRPTRVKRNVNLCLKVPNWKTLVQDIRRWKELVEKAKTLHKGL